MSFPVLTREGEPLTAPLEVGLPVQVMHLSGRCYATVTILEPDGASAFAEDEWTMFPLRLEAGKWVGDSAWSKSAMKQFMEYRPERTTMSPEVIAEVCHEACRALTRHAKDVPVQPSWAEAPEEMRVSTIAGVKWGLANLDAPPSASHSDWMRLKLEAGWTHGPTKDPKLKKHPALVPWEKLPVEAREKDAVFTAIVRALAPK